jgi:lipoprotein-anchoring transpeptidase ErfK/SrfK
MLTPRSWAVLIGAATLAAAQPVHARGDLPAKFPAAGVALHTLVVRAQPGPAARVVRRMRRFRDDLQLQIVLALSERRGSDGEWWYRLSLPGRPNGQRGWVRNDAVDVSPVRNRIVVRLGMRQIEVQRIRDGKVLLRGIVAVGRRGAETPLGRDYYVRSAFVPTDPFFGTFAMETSAASRLTDWPDHGIVGIHGTNRPQLLGQAVSHGCIRVNNTVATRLRALAPLGTSIDIVP